MTLAGTFATRAIDMRASMNENSFKGIIRLQKRNLSTQTKLTSKLGEMDLFNRLSFTQPAMKKKNKQPFLQMLNKKTPERFRK